MAAITICSDFGDPKIVTVIPIMINLAGKQAYSSMHHHMANLSSPLNKRKQRQQMHYQVTNIKQWAALLFALFVFIAASIHLYICDPMWTPHFYLQWRKHQKKVNGNRTNRIKISGQLLVSARAFYIYVPVGGGPGKPLSHLKPF